MKKPIRSLTACLLIILMAIPAFGLADQQPTKLTLYEGPKTMRTSGDAVVTVNGYDFHPGCGNRQDGGGRPLLWFRNPAGSGQL